MDQNKIIHIDMDAFYAAVEIRDNPSLKGLPLVIGAKPTERGVVCTCSYEAREYGVCSAMSIKEAFRRCPHAIYMYPNMDKYIEASAKIHKIWEDYTDVLEYISLDEGFLDVTKTHHLFNGVKAIGHEIKKRIKMEVGLTCSVGIGYSKTSAKLASEEKKPDGFFEINNKEQFKNLIINRDIRVIYGVGAKTAALLGELGILTVKDIYDNQDKVIESFGTRGQEIVNLACGIDARKVISDIESKSISLEETFQEDITDTLLLQDILRLKASKLSFDIKVKGLYASTISIKLVYANMKSITRSKTIEQTNNANVIYKIASAMLQSVEKAPVRLIGISLSKLTKTPSIQLNLVNYLREEKEKKLEKAVLNVMLKYGENAIKPASVLKAEKNSVSER